MKKGACPLSYKSCDANEELSVAEWYRLASSAYSVRYFTCQAVPS